MGLAFSERAVRVIEFVEKKNGLALGKFGVRELPPNAIKEGYVNDKLAVTKELRFLQKELAMEFVSASLPDEKAYLFKIEIPKVNEGDIRQTIEMRLEENVPLKGQDAVFDYAFIPSSDKKDHLDVSVSVLPSKVVETYLEIIKDAGLKAVSFGVESGALSRALIPKGDLGTFMIVNVSDTHTGLSIVSHGVVQFSLTVAVGGDAFTSAIEKHFSVSALEAKKIKDEKGFVKNADSAELFSSLVNTLSAIKDEINKLFVYWRTHKKHSDSAGEKIEKIILCGRDGSLSGFDDYLSVAMKVPVVVGNVWQNAFSYEEHIPAIPLLDSLDYASAVGLALPQ